MIKRVPLLVHLHWAWEIKPGLLANTMTGMSVCGRSAVAHQRLTNKLDYVTCEACREIVRQRDKARADAV